MAVFRAPTLASVVSIEHPNHDYTIDQMIENLRSGEQNNYIGECLEIIYSGDKIEIVDILPSDIEGYDGIVFSGTREGCIEALKKVRVELREKPSRYGRYNGD